MGGRIIYGLVLQLHLRRSTIAQHRYVFRLFSFLLWDLRLLDGCVHLSYAEAGCNCLSNKSAHFWKKIWALGGSTWLWQCRSAAVVWMDWLNKGWFTLLFIEFQIIDMLHSGLFDLDIDACFDHPLRDLRRLVHWAARYLDRNWSGHARPYHLPGMLHEDVERSFTIFFMNHEGVVHELFPFYRRRFWRNSFAVQVLSLVVVRMLLLRVFHHCDEVFIFLSLLYFILGCVHPWCLSTSCWCKVWV
jgi:hypothetical protein